MMWHVLKFHFEKTKELLFISEGKLARKRCALDYTIIYIFDCDNEQRK